MPVDTLTPAEALHALLVPPTHEGQMLVEENPILKRLSERYKNALAKENPDAMKLTIGKIARELHDEHLLDAPPERVVDTFDFEPYEMRVAPSEAQEETPEIPSISQKKSQKPSSGGGGEPAYQKLANEKLKQIIRGSVQQEFENLLKTTPEDKLPDAIETFYHTHLSAAGIVGSQYKVLLDQSRKLYGGEEEFDKHADALSDAAKQKTYLLAEAHTVGPLRPGETLDALSRQRELEQANIANLQIIAKQQPHNLASAMNQVFDAEWARREDDRVMQQFLNELKAYNYSHSAIYEDFVAPTVAVTTTAQEYVQERGTTQVSQAPTFSQEQQGGSGTVSNIGQQAKNIAERAGKRLKKKAKRKVEEEIAKQAVKQVAMTGFRAVLTNPYVLAAVGIIFLVIFIIILIVIIIMAFAGQNQQQNQSTPIPGLDLSVSPSQGAIKNGETIPFVIDVFYSGTDFITLKDTVLTSNATVVPSSVTGKAQAGSGGVNWILNANTPLPDSTSTTKHYQFRITLQPVSKDIVVQTQVDATYTYGAPMSGPSSKPTAGGYCSPEYLAQLQYFGSLQVGQIASCVCKYESDGDPGSENKACLTGGTADYSIGLFQMNLLAHCDGALAMHGNVCSVVNEGVLKKCEQDMLDPDKNIKAAVALYHRAGGWTGPWAAEKGKCF